MIREQILSTIFDDHKNVLIHGMAGTGKTYLLKEIASIADTLGICTYSTATTGIASINLLRGSTFHHYAGIQTAWQNKEDLFRIVRSNRKARERILQTQLLIIDEISMYGTNLLSKVNYVFKSLRCNSMPFGGIQLVFSGDFLQLPPVKDEWLFLSPEWKELSLIPYVLIECKRYLQKDFFEMLDRIRKGIITKTDLQILRKRESAYKELILNPKTDIIPTKFFSRKKDAEIVNIQKLDELTTKPFTFIAVDHFNIVNGLPNDKKEYIEMLDNSIPREITLKVGAQVMLKWNIDPNYGLVNGSRGIITRIEKDVFVKFVNGTELIIDKQAWTYETYNAKATRIQIPLELAWATTIHKSQGLTLDLANVDIGNTIFEYGQAYVALSRVRNIEGLFISKLNPSVIVANDQALEYVKNIEEIDHPNKIIELSFE